MTSQWMLYSDSCYIPIPDHLGFPSRVSRQMDRVLSKLRGNDSARHVVMHSTIACAAVGTRTQTLLVHVPSLALLWRTAVPAAVEQVVFLASHTIDIAIALSDWSLYIAEVQAGRLHCVFRSADRALSKPAENSLQLRCISAAPLLLTLASTGRSSIMLAGTGANEHENHVCRKSRLEGKRAVIASDTSDSLSALFASHTDGSVRMYKLPPIASLSSSSFSAKQLDSRATAYLPPPPSANGLPKQQLAVARCLLYMPERQLLLAGDDFSRVHAWFVTHDEHASTVTLAAASDSSFVAQQRHPVTTLVHAAHGILLPHLSGSMLCEPLAVSSNGELSRPHQCTLRSLSLANVHNAAFHPKFGFVAVADLRGETALLRGWLAQKQTRRRVPPVCFAITHLANAHGSSGEGKSGAVHYPRRTLWLNGQHLAIHDLFHGECSTARPISGLENPDELSVSEHHEYVLVMCHQNGGRRVAVVLRQEAGGELKKLEEVETQSATFARRGGPYVASVEHEGQSVAVRLCEKDQPAERFVFHLDVGAINSLFPGPMDATLTVENTDLSLHIVWLQNSGSVTSEQLPVRSTHDDRLVRVYWQQLGAYTAAGALLMEHGLVIVLVTSEGKIRVLARAPGATSCAWFSTALLFTETDGSVKQLCWNGKVVNVRDISEPGCVLHSATADRLLLVDPGAERSEHSHGKMLERQFSPTGCLLLGQASLAQTLGNIVDSAGHMQSAMKHTLRTLGVEGMTRVQLHEIAKCGFATLALRIVNCLGLPSNTIDSNRLDASHSDDAIEIQKRRELSITASNGTEEIVEVAQLNFATVEDGLGIDIASMEAEDTKNTASTGQSHADDLNHAMHSRLLSAARSSAADDEEAESTTGSVRGEEAGDSEAASPSADHSKGPSGFSFPAMDSEDSSDNDDDQEDAHGVSVTVKSASGQGRNHSAQRNNDESDDDEDEPQRRRPMASQVRIKSAPTNAGAQGADLRKAAASALSSLAPPSE